MGKALHFIGVPLGTHMVIQDARTVDPESDYQGQPLQIERGDVVPLSAFHNADWSGDVAAIHVERGFAIEIDVEDTAASSAASDAEPTSETPHDEESEA